MKKGKHPESYRTVIFQDISSPFTFLGKSTARSQEMGIWDDGEQYPLVKLSLTIFISKSVFCFKKSGKTLRLIWFCSKKIL